MLKFVLGVYSSGYPDQTQQDSNQTPSPLELEHMYLIPSLDLWQNLIGFRFDFSTFCQP